MRDAKEPFAQTRAVTDIEKLCHACQIHVCPTSRKGAQYGPRPMMQSFPQRRGLMDDETLISTEQQTGQSSPLSYDNG